jgi:phosphoribosylaminoimidazolecarboxamide formyltransferase/IMP cyclohydrolase
MLLGAGGGQTSRVDAARLAVEKARTHGHAIADSALGSDAFFPFADGLMVGVDAGVRAVVQPGGSKNDPEVIAAADAHGVTMVFTDERHFRH